MEKLNLVEILKDCHKGTKLYSTIYGEVEFVKVIEGDYYPVFFRITSDYCNGMEEKVSKDGRHILEHYGECTLFPSKNQRDWSKFNKERFDPATLKPFDKVLVRDSDEGVWYPEFFGYNEHILEDLHCQCICACWEYCIPFNEETKHLIGKEEEAPEFYRYWEEED